MVEYENKASPNKSAPAPISFDVDCNVAEMWSSVLESSSSLLSFGVDWYTDCVWSDQYWRASSVWGVFAGIDSELSFKGDVANDSKHDTFRNRNDWIGWDLHNGNDRMCVMVEMDVIHDNQPNIVIKSNLKWVEQRHHALRRLENFSSFWGFSRFHHHSYETTEYPVIDQLKTMAISTLSFLGLMDMIWLIMIW